MTKGIGQINILIHWEICLQVSQSDRLKTQNTEYEILFIQTDGVSQSEGPKVKHIKLE